MMKRLPETVAIMVAALAFYTTGFAAEQAKVFPVKAFFYDTGADSKLDPAFRNKISQLSVPALGAAVHTKLTAAFGSRVGNLSTLPMPEIRSRCHSMSLGPVAFLSTRGMEIQT